MRKSAEPGESDPIGSDRVDITRELRARSGSFTSRDPLVDVFYTLMRDHVPAGSLEELVASACVSANQEITYTNGWLATYARDLATRLRAAARKRAT